MDPVGGVASIITLIQAIHTVCSWIRSFHTAPDCVRGLHIDIIGFEIVLKGFQRAVSDESVARKIPPEQTNLIVGHANHTLQQLKTSLGRTMRANGQDVDRFQWALDEAKCQAFKQKLAWYGDSLKSILNVVQSDRSIEQQSMIEQILVLRMREPRLLQASTQVLEDLDGETEVAISEASPVESRSQPIESTPPAEPDSRRSSDSSGLSGDTVMGSYTEEEDRALAKRASKSDGKHPYSSEICSSDCTCQCHLTSTYESSSLDLQPAKSSLSCFPQLVRRCSVRECQARKVGQRGIFVISTKTFKRVVGISLISRWFHVLYHLKGARVVPESSLSIRYAMTGNLEGLRKLIESGQATVCERSRDGWSLLHNAGYRGPPEMVKYLILARADVEVGEVGTRKPADLARIRALDIDATNLERERAEAFPNWEDYKDNFEFSPIHVAVLDIYDRSDKERPSLLSLLKFVESANNAPAGQDWSTWKADYRHRSPLFLETIEEFRQEASKCRAPKKPFIDLLNQRDARQKWTPFHWATYTGRLDAMKTLIARGANPFLITGMGRNALHQAAESKRAAIMEYVLQIREDAHEGWFDINRQDQWGETPLHTAATGSAACVELLLHAGAKRDIRQEEDFCVPLHLASLAKGDEKVRVVDVLSADRGAHINSLDDRGRSPIWYHLDSPRCVELLLARGAEISLRDKAGLTVLHWACTEGYAGALELLVTAASDVVIAALDNEGDTALAKAFQFKHGACAKILLEAGAVGDMNGKDGMPLVHHAAKMGDADVLEWCFKKETYKKGERTRDGMAVKQVALKYSTFKGRVEELILQYESFGPRSDPEV